jgi:hypothetical protein
MLKSSASWNDSMEQSLLNLCVTELRKGNCGNNGFKKSNWNTIVFEFHQETGVSLDKNQLQSKYSSLKDKYNVFMKLKSNSGFGWDEERRMVTAPPDVWTNYLINNPKAKQFQTMGLKYLDLSADVIEGTSAVGISF